MSTEDNRFWLGTGLGVLGLVPPIVECLKRDFQLAALYSLVLLLMLAWFFFSLRSGRGPQYATLSMKKTLEIVKADGSIARMRREQHIRVNYGQLSEIWCRNIVADGCIQNLLIDNNPPDDQKRMGCLLSICKRFGTPLFKGQETTIVWTYELRNSFPARTEALEHDVKQATRYLELTIVLPVSRPCRGASLHELIAGDPDKLLPNPVIDMRGTVIKAILKHPEKGRTIRLTWEW